MGCLQIMLECFESLVCWWWLWSRTNCYPNEKRGCGRCYKQPTHSPIPPAPPLPPEVALPWKIPLLAQSSPLPASLCQWDVWGLVRRYPTSNLRPHRARSWRMNVHISLSLWEKGQPWDVFCAGTSGSPEGRKLSCQQQWPPCEQTLYWFSSFYCLTFHLFLCFCDCLQINGLYPKSCFRHWLLGAYI